MHSRARHSIAIILALVLVLISQSTAVEYDGKVKFGYLFLDEDGNRGVNQPTYNLYEGAGLSFENFSFRFDNGTRIYGNLRNLTMNNRNLFAGVTKAGMYGVTIRHHQYRRRYFSDVERSTRRDHTNAQAWLEPADFIRVYGGYGVTDKKGEMVALIDPGLITPIEFGYKYYNAGVKLQYERSYLQFDYRGSDFKDDLDSFNDRTSNRFKISAFSPVPGYENLILNAGFQHFENNLKQRFDSLSANTTWGGARYYFEKGFSLRYSFIWDRARRTGDLAATDNISHAVYADKVWDGDGGVTIGYRFKINDEVYDELKTNGYHLSGWYRPMVALTFRAGYGSDREKVTDGVTLTGDQDRSRFYIQGKYRAPYGFVRLQYQDKQTDNDDIGSKADFSRVSADGRLVLEEYGNLEVSYAFLDGRYDNSGGRFVFKDHVVSGDLFSREFHQFRAGFGGTYSRSVKDVDVEASQLRFSGEYRFDDGYGMEIIYRAFNFDDLDDQSFIYSQYYTANVVEVSLYYEL
jgi:hypothetical protein